jgi:hypothetical protein
MRPIVSLQVASTLRRVRYSRLKGAAFVRGGRYGISIDFGLEIVERKSTCGATVNLELSSVRMTPWLPDGLIVTRDGAFFKFYGCSSAASLDFSMSLALGHAEASAAKRLRSNAQL